MISMEIDVQPTGDDPFQKSSSNAKSPPSARQKISVQITPFKSQDAISTPVRQEILVWPPFQNSAYTTTYIYCIYIYLYIYIYIKLESILFYPSIILFL